MKHIRLSGLLATAGLAALLSGCVVAPIGRGACSSLLRLPGLWILALRLHRQGARACKLAIPLGRHFRRTLTSLLLSPGARLALP